MTPMRVLFLRTHNSARSQMAEALLRSLSHGRIDVHSAGPSPAREIHPLAESILREKYHVDLHGHALALPSVHDRMAAGAPADHDADVQVVTTQEEASHRSG